LFDVITDLVYVGTEELPVQITSPYNLELPISHDDTGKIREMYFDFPPRSSSKKYGSFSSSTKLFSGIQECRRKTKGARQNTGYLCSAYSELYDITATANFVSFYRTI
jgi:hypothetical protein